MIWVNSTILSSLFSCVSRWSRAVFKWLSKVISWLRLLRLVIGLKESCQFFNQWEVQPKPIAPCMGDFSCALSKLHVIARNCDWFFALFRVIGQSDCFGFGFSTVIWKLLYQTCFVFRFGYHFIANTTPFPWEHSQIFYHLTFQRKKTLYFLVVV